MIFLNAASSAETLPCVHTLTPKQTKTGIFKNLPKNTIFPEHPVDRKINKFISHSSTQPFDPGHCYRAGQSDHADTGFTPRRGVGGGHRFNLGGERG